MEYSDAISPVTDAKFPNDLSYFIHWEKEKLTIRESNFGTKIIGAITLPATIKNAEISTDSKYVAISIYKRNIVYIFEIESAKIFCKIENECLGVESLFWVPGSLQLMVFSLYNHQISIYDFVKENVSYLSNPKLTTNRGFSFSHSGHFLALLQKNSFKDYLTIFETTNWEFIRSVKLDLLDAVEVKWSSKDDFITVIDHHSNYKMAVFNLDLKEIEKFKREVPALGIKKVRYSNDFSYLAVGSYDEKIRLINVLTWAEYGVLSMKNSINCENLVKMFLKEAVYIEEEGNNDERRMKYLEEKNYKIPTVRAFTDDKKGIPNTGPSIIEFSKNNCYIACKNENMPYSVWIWEFRSLSLVAIITCVSHIKGIEWTKNENYLCITTGSDSVIFWHEIGIQVVPFKFQHKKFCIQKIQFHNDGMKAIFCDKNEILYTEMPEV